MAEPLPIEAALPRLRAALGAHHHLLLTAEPGAGKTTVLPRLLLEVHPTGEVWVLQPRRLAARLAARRVAALLGEAVGEQVGYRVRFEDCVGTHTRLIFMTEGVFLRSLLQAGRLRQVAAVVFDEFHGRSLEADLGLAAVLWQQRQAPSPLRVVVMSATLEVAPLAALLDDPAVLHVPGRAYPVAVRFFGPREATAWVTQACRGLAQLLEDPAVGGNILAFLPGVAEIERLRGAVAGLCRRHDLDVVPLHGSLQAAEQDAATGAGSRRRLILATNVAETSVTLPDIGAVLDTGLCRRARCDPWSGIARLELESISQAEAAQRAGRAGRTRPGHCLRLYTAAALQRWPRQPQAELLRLDLCGTVLWAAAMGLPPLPELPLLDAPPAPAHGAASTLLTRLRALSPGGALTPLGRQLARLPLHPRLGRLVCAAAAAGIADLGCLAAATLSEPAAQRAAAAAPARGPADCDLSLSLSAAAPSTRRLQRQLRRLCPKQHRAPPPDAEAALCRALLYAFPDRVARRLGEARQPGAGEATLQLCGGGQARLAAHSSACGAPFVVALEAMTQAGAGLRRTVVTRAAAILPDWLLDLDDGRLQETLELRFEAKQQRVLLVRRLCYEALVLDEATELPEPGAAVAEVLEKAVWAAGLQQFVDPAALQRLRARLSHVAPDGAEASVDAACHVALRALCGEVRSFAELRQRHLWERLQAALCPELRAALQTRAPETVRLQDGRTLAIHYEAGKAPWVAAPLQQFFGTLRAPTLGEAPLTLHLLAPNQRCVQVTNDLASFWKHHYPALKKTLSRRYPRHAWPDDPLTAQPPPRRRV